MSRVTLLAARLTAILACVDAAPIAHADAIDRTIELYRAHVEAEIEKTHWNVEDAGLDDLVAKAEQRLRAGESGTQVNIWTATELKTRWLSFAPIRSAPRFSVKYQLPFDPLVHWLVAQGTSSGGSHTGSNQFALDFWMPEGTPVLASRGGTVTRVLDGFTRCCLPKEQAYAANQVYVLHSDGTFALYGHLRPGVVVKVGQAVKEGDLLGYSGSTGWASLPHLHFEVDVRDTSSEQRSIPIKFENRTHLGYRPEPGGYYMNRPPLPVHLRVAIDGSEVVSGEPFLLRGRAPVSVSVHAIGTNGAWTDVTRSPHTRYVPVTPWSVRIDDAGHVQFGLSSQKWVPIPEPLKSDLAILAVLYRDPERGDGAFDVLFRFPDTGPPVEHEPGS